MFLLLIILLVVPQILFAQTTPGRNFIFHTAATSGNGTEVDVNGLNVVGVALTGGSGSDRVVTFEVSDRTTVFTAISCINISTRAVATTAALSGTTTFRYQCAVGGFKKFRVSISGGTTGTVTAIGFGLASGAAMSSATGSGTSNWADLLSGENTTGAFVVGTGSSLQATGTGIIAATTATELEANPVPCTVGNFVTDIAADGTLTCGVPAGGGDVTVSGTPTIDQIAVWTDTNTIKGVSELSFEVTDLDLATATRTRPNKVGTTDPATCAVGDTFVDSDAAPVALRLCTAVNTWASIGGSTTFPLIGTSAANPCFAVGPNGSTNPALAVSCATASAVGGLLVTGNADGSGGSITATGTSAAQHIFITSKGSGTLALNTGSGGQMTLSSNSGQKAIINSTGVVFTPPATQTIADTNTIAADACGGIKRLTSGGAVTTNTTNTFTAPATANTGCVMHVCNVGTNNIVLDTNALFKSLGAADVTLGADDCVVVGQHGTIWYQLTGVVLN